jgi:hypothetical protein
MTSKAKSVNIVYIFLECIPGFYLLRHSLRMFSQSIGNNLYYVLFIVLIIIIINSNSEHSETKGWTRPFMVPVNERKLRKEVVLGVKGRVCTYTLT